MASNEATVRVSAVAGADLSADTNIYKFVEGTRASVTLANADTDIAMGVLHSLGTSGRAVDVAIAGITKLRVAGTPGAQVRIAPDTDGRGKLAAAGDQVRAITLEAATADNDLISVRLVDSFALLA
jgi:hypothetical protein